MDEIFGTESSRLFPKDDLYRSLTKGSGNQFGK